MEAKDKAVEIFKKYYCMENNSSKKIKCIEFQTAKKCALIAVDEITKVGKKVGFVDSSEHDFWQEVKQEINKL